MEKEEIIKNSEAKKPKFIIGIGASAGGLEAIQDFFYAMPTNLGVSFVIIQHLSSDFKILMEQLLKKNTQMQILFAKDSMPIEANTIYLAPPKANITVKGYLLHKTEQNKESLNSPIDIFFQSLASEWKNKSIGVILTGTGSDGSEGVRNISNAGGLVIAQDPETAKFDSMPRSAIATERVNCILKINNITKAIATYIESPAEFDDLYHLNVSYYSKSHEKIFSLLFIRFKIDFSQYKITTTSRRIDRRISALSLSNIAEYTKFLNDNVDELDLLFKDLLIGVTHFFRDIKAFDFIKSSVLPAIVSNKQQSQETIRIWVSACATGEEAYSIAILLQEYLNKNNINIEFKIFASDINRDFLDTASQGIYSFESISKIPTKYLDNYFNLVNDNSFQVIPVIRNKVVFTQHNLLVDTPFTKIDLVCCRNFLIYVLPHIQEKIIDLFRFSLAVNGYLFLGPSETAGNLKNDLECINSTWKVYEKICSSRIQAGTAIMPYIKDHSSRTQRKISNSHVITNQAYDLLLDKFIDNGILIDSNHNIVHIFGNAHEFLQYRTGRINNCIFDSIDQQLKIPLNAALHQANQEKESIHYKDIFIEQNNNDILVTLNAFPLCDEKNRINYYLVQIIKSDTQLKKNDKLKLDTKQNIFKLDEQSKIIISNLENELLLTKESLQTTLEEVETTNEELQSTNEELLAYNEELHSSNEELHSINEEYEKKIEELTKTNNDIDNFIRSTEIGMIFIDKEMLIHRLTPSIAEIFELGEQDTGKSLYSLTNKINYPNLSGKINEVIKSSNTFIEKVQLHNGRWSLMRIHPYLIKDNLCDGAIITFLDIHDLIKANETIRVSETRYKKLIETISSVVWNADCNGEFPKKSESWGCYTGQSNEEAEGMGWLNALAESYYDTVKNSWLKSVFNKEPFNIEAKIWNAKSNDYHYVRLNAAPIIENNEVKEWVGSLSDINIEKKANEKFKLAIQASPIAMLIINEQGIINFVNKPTEVILGYKEGELLNNYFEKLISPETYQNNVDNINNHLNNAAHKKTISRFEVCVLKKDGTRFPAEATLSSIITTDGILVICALVDISAQKEAASILENLVNESKNKLEEERLLRLESEQLFSENKLLYEKILDATTDGWWDWNLETNDEYLSPKFKKLFGYNDDELPNKPEGWQKIIYKEDLDFALKSFNNHINLGEPFTPIVRYHCKNGDTKWILCRGKAIKDKDGQYRRMIGTHTDITSLKETEQRLQRNICEIDIIHNSVKIANSAKSINEALQECITLICQYLGFDIGHVYNLISDDNLLHSQDIWFASGIDNINDFKSASEKYTFKKGVGLPGKVWESEKAFWVENIGSLSLCSRAQELHKLNIQSAVAIPIFVSGEVESVFEFFSFKKSLTDSDILRTFEVLSEQIGSVFEKRRSEEQMENLAHYDSITNLPNRAFFNKTLSRAINRIKRSNDNEHMAVLYCDLDNFKKVNDSMGHHIGDKLLKKIASVLTDSAREEDFVARLGGDEFIVLAENIQTPNDAAAIAKRILSELESPIHIGRHEIRSSISIGIAVYPSSGLDEATLLKNADMAMYLAKSLDKGNYQFFCEDLDRLHRRNTAIEYGLHKAIENNEFSLYYQPQIDCKTEKISSIESLIRWNKNPILGEVSPGEFIPIAEDSGLILNIGEWVLIEACRQFKAWQEIKDEFSNIGFSVSINVSVRQLANDSTMKSFIDIIKSNNIPVGQLTIEVTETSLMKNIISSKKVLRELHSLGVGIAIDDFGKGYSSFSYLKQLPFTALKIDKSFIDDIERDSDSAAIVQSIIQLGNVMNLNVIAEGVETKEQLKLLQSVGCHFAQGHYISKPLPAGKIVEFIKDHNKIRKSC